MFNQQYIQLFTFIGTGILFLALTFLVSKILRPAHPDAEKLSTYECGEEAISFGQIQFNSRFFVVALVFVLFEVEIIFLFPWAITFSNPPSQTKLTSSWAQLALIEMLFFVLIIALGLAYAWAKGHLDWIRPETKPTDFKSPIPSKAYEHYTK
jgi:NADH-quinone oxidoreductase subunit A